MQERTIPLPITIGLLVAVIVSVGIFMKSKEYTQLVQDFPAAAEAASAAQSTFATWDTASWHYTAMAERDVQELGEGQRIIDGIIVDPTDNAIAYFATSAFDAKKQEMTLSIYRYDMQGLSFTRLYFATYRKGQSRYLGKTTWPLWHVIGYDRERIVVVLKDVDLTRGACDVPLLVGIEGGSSAIALTLSLDDPSTGLMTYTPQEKDVTEARAVYTQCLSK